MAKLTLDDISNISGAESTAIGNINGNSAKIEAAMENTLSLDGTSPNQMGADLDMNSNDILNVNLLQASDITIDGSDVTGVLERVEQAADAAEQSATDAETAQTAAETAQGAAEDALADFNEKYLGAYPDDTSASTAAGGNPIVGAEYWNTADSVRKTWDGTQWLNTSTTLNDGDVTDSKIADSYKQKIVGVVADRTTLAAMTGTTYQVVELTEEGREGIFFWNSGDLSAKVTIDTEQGVYVPPTSDTTGATGCWVRQFDGDVWANWFGLASTNTGTQNVTAINAAITLAANLKTGTALPTGEFDIEVAGTPNGIRLVSNSHLHGQGSRYTILNAVGNSTNTMIDNYTGGFVIGRTFTPGVANGGVNNALVEDLAVVLNHPGDSINTGVCLQIGIDFRNINRSTIRRCWVGNYHPRLNTKGISQDFLVQGYGIMLGGKPGGNVDYAHQECNLIEENTLLGAYQLIAIEGRAVDTGPAYNTIIRKNDIQTAHTLIYQASSSGAGNVIKDNTLQNLVHPNGNANPTRGIFMAGYGNIIDEPYGEYGSEANYILYLTTTAKRNYIRYTGTCTVAGGLVGSFADNGANPSYNIIEYFANTGGAGTWNSQGAPTRKVSGVDTVIT